MYKGRKKKTIEYFAVKSVDKSQRSKVLNEVSHSPPRCYWDLLAPRVDFFFRSKLVGGVCICLGAAIFGFGTGIHVLLRVCCDSRHLFDKYKSSVGLGLGCIDARI